VRASQQAARPVFALDRAHLDAGEHELHLRARLPDGRTAESTPQHFRVPGPVAAVPARDAHRFSVQDERWGEGLLGVLDPRGEERRQLVARPALAT
jgi:hypothetical protein